MKIGVIITKATTINGVRRRAQEFLEVNEAFARALTNAGAASYADGRSVVRRLVAPSGHAIRDFDAERAAAPRSGRTHG